MEKVFHTNRFISLLSDNFKLLSVITILIFIYYYYTNKFEYFKKRNVKYIKPIIFFGSNVSGIFSLKSQLEVMRDFYNDLKGHRFGGNNFVIYIYFTSKCKK